MHTEIGASNVPAFLTKLWKLVEDSDYDHLILWGPTGRSFIIRDQARFAKELLPLYFKHNNMASFIRQLNMYGFRKVVNIENSGLRTEKDEIEFHHSYFKKGQENLLEFIKRKVRNENSLSMGNTKSVNNDEKIKKEEVNTILMDMKGIKGKQDSIDSFLVNLRRENEALWREVALLRQKHQKQQQIVEKLIQFFLTLVHNRGIGIKRNYPLMIDAKNGGSSQMHMNLPSNEQTGPVIHDVTDHLLDEESAEQTPLLTVPAGTSEFCSSGGSNSSSSCNISTALIDENSKSPFSTGDFNEQEANKFPAIGFESLEQDFQNIGEQSVAADIMSNITLPEGLDQLTAQQQQELLSLEQPLDDHTNLIEEQVINHVDDGLKVSSSDPLQLQTTSSALCRPSELNSLVPSSSSVLNTPTYTLENFDDHLENIEQELSSLQDHLAFGTMNIDENTLLGLFSPVENSNGKILSPNENCENQMIEYVPHTLSNSENASTPTVTVPGTSNLANASNYFDQSMVNSTSSTPQSVPTGTKTSVDLLGGDLSSTSLNSKDELTKQLEELNQSGLFDATSLLNSNADIEALLESRSQNGSDKKRRRVA